MDEEKKATLRKFIDDPEWHIMEEFIKDNFKMSDSVHTIDTTKSTDVIIADVVSRQRIAEMVTNLMRSFNMIKSKPDEKNQRRKLK